MLASLLQGMPFDSPSVDFHALAPELVLTGAIVAVLLADLFTPEGSRGIVPSIAEAAKRLPSALKARHVSLAKPAKVSIERPVLGSQILTVRSWLAVARRLPSALNARPTAKSVCA